MNFSKLVDTPKSIDKLLDDDIMNLSFSSSLDSDIDTNDMTLNNEEISYKIKTTIYVMISMHKATKNIQLGNTNRDSTYNRVSR
jgi:hypothetical protein